MPCDPLGCDARGIGFIGVYGEAHNSVAPQVPFTQHVNVGVY